MSVSIDEHRLGGLRWIVVNGPDREAFRALGEHVRAGLAALTETWPVLPRLRQHVSGPPGRDRLAAVRQATAAECGEEWAELAAFAEGATAPFDDLALLNLRGDLGPVEGGIGCSDPGVVPEPVGHRAQRGRRAGRCRPVRPAHAERERSAARHRLLVSRLPAGQRVRGDR
jgi:hypothetical protein